MNKTALPNRQVERIHTDKDFTVELEYFNGSPIDDKKFIEHIITKPRLSGPISAYAVRCIENIVEYGKGHKTASKDQLAYFLYSLIPEIEFKEVVAFIEDESLTANAVDEKYSYWDNWDGGDL